MHYGGLEKKYTLYDHSAIVILPVPYDGTSTWIKGADKGPEAILEASANMELFDIDTGFEVYRKGIHTAQAIDHKGKPELLADKVETRVSSLLGDGKFPVLLGGEHSVSIGAFRAFARRFDDLSILQMDAHSDLRNEYEGSGYNHACVMARAKELAPITQVGIRSMDIEERPAMDTERVFFRTQIREDKKWMQQVSDQLSDHVYVTIDLDVLDPSIMPSTGTPEPDGLYYHEVMELLRLIGQNHTIAGFDVVELCPDAAGKAPDFLAAKLVYQLLSLKFNPGGGVQSLKF
ncbi:MAG: agmatinase [Bacteroidales bacterium]|jgi:agmatinase